MVAKRREASFIRCLPALALFAALVFGAPGAFAQEEAVPQEPVVTDGCHLPKPADIAVHPRSAELALVTDKSRAEMQGQKIDTINPYGFDTQTRVNGYMSGTLGLRSEVKLDYAIDSNTGGVCLWYDRVAVTIDLAPEITIASEAAQDECMYDAILEHEKLHVRTDRVIANRTAETIGRKVYDGLAQRGFLVGPIARAQAQETIERMKQTVAQIVEMENRRMEIERAEAQQAVDSREEYERVNALCPGFARQ